jgi:hypothetical protein
MFCSPGRGRRRHGRGRRERWRTGDVQDAHGEAHARFSHAIQLALLRFIDTRVMEVEARRQDPPGSDLLPLTREPARFRPI